MEWGAKRAWLKEPMGVWKVGGCTRVSGERGAARRSRGGGGGLRLRRGRARGCGLSRGLGSAGGWIWARDNRTGVRLLAVSGLGVDWRRGRRDRVQGRRWWRGQVAVESGALHGEGRGPRKERGWRWRGLAGV